MKIYVSHSHGDEAKKVAAALADAILSAGHEPVSSASRVQLGDDYEKSLRQSLKESDAYIFVVDENWAQNRRLQHEWSSAVEQSWEDPDKPMIPFLIGNVDTPPFLRERQSISLGSDWQADIQEALTALQNKVNVSGQESGLSEKVRGEKAQRFADITQHAQKLEPTPATCETAIERLQARLDMLREKDPQSPEIADIEIKLADALKAVGRTETAVIHLQSALDLLQNRSDAKNKIAQLHMNLGRSLQKLGKDTDALFHWQEALSLYQPIEGTESITNAIIHAALGTLNERLGNLAAAEEHKKAFGSLLANAVKKIPIVGYLFNKFFGAPQEEDGSAKTNPIKVNDKEHT